MMRLHMMIGAVALMASPAAAAGFEHPKPEGFKAPAGYHAPETPSLAHAYAPPPVPRAATPRNAMATVPEMKSPEPFKPFTGTSVYSNSSPFNPYPEKPANRPPGF